MFENWRGCTVEEERKKIREEKEEEEGKRERVGAKGNIVEMLVFLLF
jgi:hypothetical protein